MNNRNQKFGNYGSQGFSLVELMISLLITFMIAITAIAAFGSHSRTLYNQITYNQAAEDVSEAYALLSRLIQQAERSSISISGVTTEGNCTTDITIDLAVPAGFYVWPNSVAPYDKNWVRIALSDTGTFAHSITIANAVQGSLGSAAVTPFAGSDTARNTKITCLNLAQQNDGTYAFGVVGYARNYTAGDIAFEGVILPRN